MTLISITHFIWGRIRQPCSLQQGTGLVMQIPLLNGQSISYCEGEIISPEWQLLKFCFIKFNILFFSETTQGDNEWMHIRLICQLAGHEWVLSIRKISDIAFLSIQFNSNTDWGSSYWLKMGENVLEMYYVWIAPLLQLWLPHPKIPIPGQGLKVVSTADTKVETKGWLHQQLVKQVWSQISLHLEKIAKTKNNFFFF